MSPLQRAAIIAELVDELRTSGSWCGETHIQKAAYFLQELAQVPLDFDFGLYKHGPYSFDLRDTLTELRADGLLDLQPQPYPYGPSWVPTATSRQFRDRFPKTLDRYQGAIRFVAETLRNKGVIELEQLSTALLVAREVGAKVSAEARAQRICRLKPHVNHEEALQAVKAVDEILQRLPTQVAQS